LKHILGSAVKKRKAFTIVEVMVVVIIVGILASLAIPIMRGRIDAAKWSEGKTMMGSIATAIRAYRAEKGPTGALPTVLGVGATGLGFSAGDLTGNYFADADFTFVATAMDPLTYTITCTPATAADRPTNPPFYQLNQAGGWTP
jgi:prepilin-type N-terminal cleavage/methylation domain-containing protein